MNGCRLLKSSFLFTAGWLAGEWHSRSAGELQEVEVQVSYQLLADWWTGGELWMALIRV